MANFQILVVAPVGRAPALLTRWEPYNFEFQFVENFPADGLSAWRGQSSSSGEIVNVASNCRSYEGGYAQHALNRLFSQSLLRLKPKLVVIFGLAGCTVDLTRVANLLEIPVLLILDKPVEPVTILNEATQTWLRSSLSVCKYILPERALFDRGWPVDWLEGRTTQIGDLDRLVDDLLNQPRSNSSYDYSFYEFTQRDHPLLLRMQQGDTRHFKGCSRVLDLACGVGIFLDCLRQAGINAEGVERDARVASYAKGMGLNVSVADVLDFLTLSESDYDGIYCSHFVEHLTVEAVQRVLQLIATRIVQGGIVVLVFPDPESIRTQLLGFWRDPEHVRFYHPELVISMAATVGLELEWSSYVEQPHRVVPFTEMPTPILRNAPAPSFSATDLDSSRTLGEKILQSLGLVSERRVRRLEERIAEWSRALENQSLQALEIDHQLESRTSVLWDINQTWCWNDNVTLKFRKSSVDD